MKEIGGYFGLEQFVGNEYYKDLIAVNNARNALLYVLKARKINKLYIPYFLCESVSGMCDREGYWYEYYHIGVDFLPIFDKKLSENEYLYVVNYYGQIDNDKIIELKNKYGNIIVDNVQAFFQKPIKGIDTVYSCRKFFGVPDGGYVATDCRLDEELETDVSKDRMKHILGRYEGNASDYYREFKDNDTSFKTIPLRYMSKLTHNLLGVIDYERIIQKRNENYAFLAEKLRKNNRLQLNTPIASYAYPFYCENGMEVKKKMAEKGIYVATLWPNVLDMESSIEKDFAENILPLPIDQRYGITEMKTIEGELKKCLN